MANTHNPSTHINSLSKAVISQLGGVAESTKAQIVDNADNAVGVTSGALDVNVKSDDAGIALDATLTDGSQKNQIVDGSGNFLYPSGTPVLVAGEITRPADTDAYTAGDVINTDTAEVLEFDNLAITNTGGGILMEVKAETNITTFGGQFIRLWIYNVSPAVPLGDNVAFVNSYADKNSLLFFIDVLMEDLLAGSDSVIGITSIAKEYITVNKKLYIVPQTISAITPTSGGKLNITLTSLKLS